MGAVHWNLTLKIVGHLPKHLLSSIHCYCFNNSGDHTSGYSYRCFFTLFSGVYGSMTTSTIATLKLTTTSAKAIACLSSVGIVVLALGASPAKALTLTNGSLNVGINDSNGAINSLVFGGSEFYNRGFPVADYGFQNGTNASTFTSNGFSTSGQPVTVTGGSGSANVAGTYTGGGANISFNRVYSLVSGLNVLRTATTFVNKGADTTLSAFDTFDPDQSPSTSTRNDVRSLTTGAGSAKIGEAVSFSSALTVIIGSLNPSATVGFGPNLSISDGAGLNSLFSSPSDPNGALGDISLDIGIRQFLTAGSSFSYTFDQAFGTSATNAQNAFVAANSGTSTAIPTPALLPGLIAMGVNVLRKRKAEVAKVAN